MLNRIRELRLEKGWRQVDLAELMHTKRQTIARYETGQLGIDADTICKLCDVFGCTADYLLCRSSRPAPELTPAEEELLFAYAAATPEIRDIVDNALSRYKKDGGFGTVTA